MTVLGPYDPLPHATARILVTGASGAGKSTLRETISTALHLPTVEIDSLHHGPHWTPRPSFATEVEQRGPRDATISHRGNAVVARRSMRCRDGSVRRQGKPPTERMTRRTRGQGRQHRLRPAIFGPTSISPAWCPPITPTALSTPAPETCWAAFGSTVAISTDRSWKSFHTASPTSLRDCVRSEWSKFRPQDLRTAQTPANLIDPPNVSSSRNQAVHQLEAIIVSVNGTNITGQIEHLVDSVASFVRS